MSLIARTVTLYLSVLYTCNVTPLVKNHNLKKKQTPLMVKKVNEKSPNSAQKTKDFGIPTL